MILLHFYFIILQLRCHLLLFYFTVVILIYFAFVT